MPFWFDRVLEANTSSLHPLALQLDFSIMVSKRKTKGNGICKVVRNSSSNYILQLFLSHIFMMILHTFTESVGKLLFLCKLVFRYSYCTNISGSRVVLTWTREPAILLVVFLAVNLHFRFISCPTVCVYFLLSVLLFYFIGIKILHTLTAIITVFGTIKLLGGNRTSAIISFAFCNVSTVLSLFPYAFLPFIQSFRWNFVTHVWIIIVIVSVIYIFAFLSDTGIPAPGVPRDSSKGRI